MPAKKTTKKKVARRGRKPSPKRGKRPPSKKEVADEVSKTAAAIDVESYEGSLDDAPKAKTQSYDIVSLVEKKLGGKLKYIAGEGEEKNGKRRREKIVAHLIADTIVKKMVDGDFRYLKDFLDRTMGQATKRVTVKSSAVDELRAWLTNPAPLPQSPSPDPEYKAMLEEMLEVSQRLRSKSGSRIAVLCEELLAALEDE